MVATDSGVLIIIQKTQKKRKIIANIVEGERPFANLCMSQETTEVGNLITMLISILIIINYTFASIGRVFAIEGWNE